MLALPPARRIALPACALPDGRTEAGIRLAVHELGNGPAVVLCHGFPELAFSWRHQLPALAEAGFRVLAPDQRGYGASDRPEQVEDYDLQHLTGDLVGLLDALEIGRAVFVGHDWGGFVVWAMAVLHPDRVAGVVGVNTPYLHRPPAPPMQILRTRLGGDDERLYLLWFQRPGEADALLGANTRLVFEKLMRRGFPRDPTTMPRTDGRGGAGMNPFLKIREVENPGEPLLSEQEIAHYTKIFEDTGFTGGINWYRNMDRNWHTLPELGVAKIPVPCLMVTAEWDAALPPGMAAGMPDLVPDLETVLIRGCGHWTQQEKPAELNRILIDWLKRRFR